jgi:hypothetical protein
MKNSCDTNCNMMGHPVLGDQVNISLPQNRNHMVRTNYDNQMTKHYNRISLAYENNLLNLQFN